MKIAQVLSASTGGIGRHVASIAPAMRDRGHQVRIFCPEVTARRSSLLILVSRCCRWRRCIAAPVPTCCTRTASRRPAMRCPVAKDLRVPLVVTWHNAVLGSGGPARAARLLQRLVARGADLTLGASSDLVAEARPARGPAGSAGAGRGPGATRRDGQPRGRTSPAGAVAGRPDGADGEPAGAAEESGLLADVAAALRDRADLQFVVVGEGPERPALERRIADDGSRITLLGHRDDVPSLLHAADLALLTSTWEARALVAQEAMLSGLPLISTRVGGIEELVGDAAVLVESGDAADAARRLIALADDPPERARLAVASLQQAAGWPDEDDVVEDLLAGYAAVRTRR